MKSLVKIFACPLCRLALEEIQTPCQRCNNCYTKQLDYLNTLNTYLDLTPDAAQPQKLQPLRTELFRSPIIPLLYERLLPPIWSMGLRQIGGIEREFRELCQFFGTEPELVIDLSCGTGMMTRKLTKIYPKIGAIDYSEKMLAQLQQQMKKEGITPDKIIIIRGDVSALPLVSNSVDAIYAGAAMHCWPDVQLAMNEIRRVLAPGGKLFATTFLKPLPSVVFRFFTLQELQKIAENAGFPPDKIEIIRRGIYAIVRCKL